MVAIVGVGGQSGGGKKRRENFGKLSLNDKKDLVNKGLYVYLDR
jgi:hypothetical protein